MFESESTLVALITRHDALVRRCISGELTFQQFCEEYNNFYWLYALDGHESDEVGRALLKKYEERIHPHRVIAADILGRLCSDEDAKRDTFVKAGRFGSAQAFEKLRDVAFPCQDRRGA